MEFYLRVRKEFYDEQLEGFTNKFNKKGVSTKPNVLLSGAGSKTLLHSLAVAPSDSSEIIYRSHRVRHIENYIASKKTIRQCSMGNSFNLLTFTLLYNQ